MHDEYSNYLQETKHTISLYLILSISHDLMKNVSFHTSFVITDNVINMHNAIRVTFKKCAKEQFSAALFYDGTQEVNSDLT